MRPIQVTKTLVAGAVGAVSASQTPASTTVLVNGTLASGGIATFATQQLVGVTSAANIAARVFTINGVDGAGNVISDTVTGVNANTVNSVQNFKTVTSITVDAGTGAAMTVDTVTIGASNPILLDQHVSPFAIGLFVVVSGTVNYTVQYTGDNVYPQPATNLSGVTWTDHPSLTAQTATKDSNVAYPAGAVRIKVNSGTGTVTFIVRQAGVWG